MGHDWKLQLLALLCSHYIYLTRGFRINDDSPDVTDVEYLPENQDLIRDDDLQKRFSKFVRIGRGLSSFVRIGRDNPSHEIDFYQPGVLPGEYVNDPEISDFTGFQPNGFETPFKRYSSFVRIGRDYGNEDDAQDVMQKRGGAFIRMGKFPTSAFIRNPEDFQGYTQPSYYRRTGRIGHSSFIRIGKRDTTNALKLSEQTDSDVKNRHTVQSDAENSTIDKADLQELIKYLYEQREDDFSNKESTDSSEDLRKDTDKKRLSNFVRIGKSPETSLNNAFETTDEKRLSNFVRIGKRNENIDKRLSNFVRIGKRSEQPLDENKRFSSFVRIGKSLFPSTPDKRFSSFVRIGKSSEHFDPLMDKRFSSFVRIGKSADPFDEEQKRYSSFVRIGKSSDSEPEKRMSSFVRIGRDYLRLKDEIKKRLSSFIRVGKPYQNENNPDKRFSSFVRIGKSSEGHDIVSNIRPRFLDSEEDGLEDKNNIDFKDQSDDLNKRALSRFVRFGRDTSRSDITVQKDSSN